MISYHSFSQCSYTPGVGCSLSITAPLTITGTPTWTGTVCIDADVTIADGGILTISSGTNVSFEPGYSFTVEDGGSLIIDDAELYASGDAGMWEGIIGEPGNYIYVDHSTILHAEIAIETSGNGSNISTLIVKNNTCIGNNEIGIYLHGEPSSLTHLIEDTEISAPALVSPKSGELGDYGILIIGPSISPSDNFQIGNSLPFTSSTTFNHIHDVAIGIRTQTANTIVQNTFIENMLITDPADMPAGSPINELDLFHNGNIGILATSFDSPNLDNILIVGNSITGGGAINNYFFQNGDPGNNAIIAYNSMSTQILSNKIEGNNVSAYLIDTAIYIRKNTSSHDIRNNIINNFTECGILSYKVGNGTTLIQNNTISRVVNPGSTDIPFGIYVDAAASNQEVNIFDNTIDKVDHGIFIRNHEYAYLRGNVINYDYGAGNTRGIFAVNCSDILIESNSATGPCYTGCPSGIIVAGYYVESCEGMLMKSNYSTNTKYGAVIDGNNQTGNMICNEMYNCLIGYAMNDVEVDAFSNDLDPIEQFDEFEMEPLPADNSWYPSNTANREKSYGSTDLTNLDWRYRNLYRDGLTPLPGFDMPTGLIDDLYLIPINEYSDYLDTCSSPYRLSGDSEEALFIAFNYKFNYWINNALDGGSEGSAYLYKNIIGKSYSNIHSL
ncbi:MAG: right-handed parallel beta-helix repeat-containing protein [Bacteroidetes bacterium]|nr:right-handed parallel beta-helix repeat-containing protein [Bacteroidota bacterium]